MATAKDGAADLANLPKMKLLGAGFSRTGTMSMKAALEIILDGPCYHMLELLKDPVTHLKAWNNYYNMVEAKQLPPGKLPKDMAAVLAPYAATQDAPAMLFYKELWEASPGSKVILTVRDNADCWYDSMYVTVYQMCLIWTSVPKWVLALMPGTKLLSEGHEMFWGEKGPFKNRFEDKEFTKQVYEDHIAAVKAAIPPDQLLVYNVKEGWGPLCKFLQVPIPDQPFPYVNESKEFAEKHIRPAKMFRDVTVALPWVAGALVVGAAAWWWATRTTGAAA